MKVKFFLSSILSGLLSQSVNQTLMYELNAFKNIKSVGHILRPVPSVGNNGNIPLLKALGYISLSS